MSNRKRTVEDILEDILAWIRFQSFSKLKKVLEEALESDQDKWVYELTDGKLSSREIARRVGVSQSTISKNWKKWHQLGIVKRYEAGTGFRYEKLISLEDADIKLEGIKSENKAMKVDSND